MNLSTLQRMGKRLAKLREPGRLLNLLGCHVAYRLKTDRLPFTPPRIDLEPNNTCNLRCEHCQVTHWSKPAVHLDISGFKRVLEQFPGLLSIKLQGMGEPFLNRELMAMLLEGERRGISMQFISNGTLLPGVVCAGLKELNRTHISFSLDGATPATFEAIRSGASFSTVIANIKELVHSRAGHSSPGISVTAVLTTVNFHELPDLVRLAKALGVDSLNLQTSLTNWGKSSMDGQADSIRLATSSQPVALALRDAGHLARELGIPLRIWREDVYSQKRKCPWPWTRTFIAANGDVVPCCILADADVICMGNVFQQSFAEIWNSPKYREFRRRIRTHRLYDFCKGCYGERQVAGGKQ